MQIHVSRDGKEIGAWSAEEARQYFYAGQLASTDLYWHEGMADWQPLPNLWAVPAPPAQPPPPPSRPPVASTPGKEARGLTITGIALPVLCAVAGSVLLDGPPAPSDPSASTSYLVGYYIGGALFLILAAYVCSLLIPRRARTVAQCLFILAFGLLAGIGKRYMPTDKFTLEMQSFAARQSQEAQNQLKETGRIEPDSQKLQDEFNKLKNISSQETPDDKKLTDVAVDLVSDLAARGKACRSAEQPLLDLGLGPEKFASTDDIDKRRAALNSGQAAVRDFVTYLQNIDGALRDRLRAKGVSSADIDEYLAGFHQSAKVDLLVAYWEAEEIILDDIATVLDLLKTNWSTWSFRDGTVVFQDDATLAAYNTAEAKLTSDSNKQADLQKKLYPSSSP